MEEQHFRDGAVVAAVANATRARLADHLVAIVDGQWAMWRWVGVRGTGFPVDDALKQGMPEAAAAADAITRCEAEEQLAREDVLASLKDEREDATKTSEEVNEIIQLTRNIRKRKTTAALPLELTPAARAALASFSTAIEQTDVARAAFPGIFDAATLRSSQLLQDVARSDRFREAVTWQNRAAILTALDPFLEHPPETSSSRFRKHRVLVAKYLQRYCLKNDSIGFFGPLGWAKWQREGEAFAVHPGQNLLAMRHVEFETWGLEALGDTLAKEHDLLQWAPPRSMPYLYLQGTTLHVPFARPFQISPAEAAVFSTCDGVRTAQEIAEMLLRAPSLGFTNPQDVYAILTKLQSMRRIVWSFDISLEDWQPEIMLRRRFEKITDDAKRQIALDALATLEAARDGIAHAAGDANALNAAFTDLETTFTQLTQCGPTREAGQTYAARTIVYEDCRRDIAVDLGPALLEALSTPLGLLLQSARWFTHALMEDLGSMFQRVFAELSQQTASPTVDFVKFMPWIHPYLFEPSTSLVEGATKRLQHQWEAILEIPEGARRVAFRSADLHERVASRFATSAPGWISARYNSPDILIDAPDAEAVRRGDYEIVLGEFHLGLNTLDAIGLVPQHPNYAEIYAALASDMPEARLIPMVARELQPTKRTHPTLMNAQNFRLILSPDAFHVPQERIVRSGDLIVERVHGELIVRTRDGRLRFNIFDVFSEFFSMQTFDSFKMLLSRQHTPRVTIDKLITCRESWRFNPKDIQFTEIASLPECFAAARRWAQELGIPRFAFYRSPLERKPYYLDFASPVYVDIFARAVRKAQEDASEGEVITLSEMLPTPDHSWLIDAEGHHYTSELRIVTLDLGK